MAELKNKRLISALLKEKVDRPPVWLMRQAGRYLPEYQAVRKKAGSFMALCKNPELASEVTMQPLKRFPLDAAILFSDILTIPDAMGLGLYFIEGEGPVFERPIVSEQCIDKLPIPFPEEELAYVMDAVSTIKKALNNEWPLIGFAGSPFTLASYMVEGKSSRDFKKVKKLMLGAPSAMHKLLNKLAIATTNYLNAQIEHGADVVMLFDSWGGVLTTHHYEAFSLFYMRQILDGLNLKREGKVIPSIIFTKGGGQWLARIADTGCTAIGLDWTTDIAKAKAQVGGQVALQGNMDPAVLLTTPSCIKQEVQVIHQRFAGNTGHVFNLGHGITPDVPPENVAAFCQAVVGLNH